MDTLKELFEGNEALFEGLEVHGRWDWSVRHPVVRLDFGGGNYEEPGYLREEAAAQLADLEKRMGLAPGDGSAPIRFRRLIETLHESAGARVVILVDEYDKPSWTRSRRRTSPAPTAASCVDCTRSSSRARPT